MYHVEYSDNFRQLLRCIPQHPTHMDVAVKRRVLTHADTIQKVKVVFYCSQLFCPNHTPEHRTHYMEFTMVDLINAIRNNQSKLKIILKYSGKSCIHLLGQPKKDRDKLSCKYMQKEATRYSSMMTHESIFRRIPGQDIIYRFSYVKCFLFFFFVFFQPTFFL